MFVVATTQISILIFVDDVKTNIYYILNNFNKVIDIVLCFNTLNT